MEDSTVSAQASDLETSLSDHSSTPSLSNGAPQRLHDTCHWNYVIFNSIARAIIAFIGIPSNILTIVILRKQTRKSPTMALISVLAVLDILTLAFHLCTLVIAIITKTTDDVILGANVRIAGSYLAAVGATLMSATINITVLIMWRRYLAITSQHIIHEKRKTFRLMILAIGVAVIYNLPRVFELKYIATTPQGVFIFQRNSFSISPAYQHLYKSFLNFTLFLYIPIALMGVMAFKAMRALAKRCRGQLMTQADINQRQISVSLIAVVCLAIVCYSLAPIRNILLYFYRDPSDLRCGGVIYYITQALLLLVLFNCSLNFFIYTWCTQRFRRAVIRLLCRSKGTVVTPHVNVITANSTTPSPNN